MDMEMEMRWTRTARRKMGIANALSRRIKSMTLCLEDYRARHRKDPPNYLRDQAVVYRMVILSENLAMEAFQIAAVWEEFTNRPPTYH